MFNIFAFSWLVILIYFVCFFIVATIIKNNSIVDIGWGFGFVVVAWAAFAFHKNLNEVNLLLCILVSIWGIRLTYYLFKRNYKKPEDFRYVQMRKSWGKKAILLAFTNVFMLQAFMMLIISSSFVYTIASNKNGINIITFIGLFIWIIGFIFESVGDKQLADFIKKPNKSEKIITTGLWKYTRHPNYFGEATLWWGIFIICFSVNLNVFLMISPLVITWLLLFVSGVPMLEKSLMKKEGFYEYSQVTSKFFPLPQKKNKIKD